MCSGQRGAAVSSSDSSDTGSSCPVVGFIAGAVEWWSGGVDGGRGGALVQYEWSELRAMLYDVLCVALDWTWAVACAAFACA